MVSECEQDRFYV